MGAQGTPTAPRDLDLRLAGVHLRAGATWLARAELEAAAGADRLDAPALADLAEARWRTGDVDGAIEAAAALPADARSAPIALALAAEAAARAGHPEGEVGRLVEAAVAAVAAATAEGGDGDIEALVGGLPTVAPWPIPSHGTGGGTAATREPATELVLASDALRAGDEEAAAIRFLVLLRRAPELAAVILDVLAGREGLLVEVVRGDALRIVGREIEADDAYATAAGHLEETDARAGGADRRGRVR